MIDKGSKVVCIKDDDWPAWARAIMNDFPVKNKIYTLRDVQLGVIGETLIKDETGKNPFQFTGPQTIQVTLEEIVNPVHPVSGKEYGYMLNRFAPVVEPPKQKTKTDIKLPTKPRKIKPPKRKKKELLDA